MMKPTLALTLLAALGGVAAAQPTTEPVDGTPADPPVVEPAPPPPKAPHPPQPAERERVSWESGGAMQSPRPVNVAFGIGIGYSFPTMSNTPNTTSVRMRLPSGLTFEPIVVLGNESTKQTAMGTTAKDSTTELTVGALARIPVVRSGKVELELLAGAGFGTTKSNPDGDDNNTTTSNLNLNWGLAVSYWMTRHWNLSFSARNTIISLVKSEREMVSGDVESSTTAVEAQFAPVVSVMLHLYN